MASSFGCVLPDGEERGEDEESLQWLMFMVVDVEDVDE